MNESQKGSFIPKPDSNFGSHGGDCNQALTIQVNPPPSFPDMAMSKTSMSFVHRACRAHSQALGRI